ncbi:hypothetical protein Avbf_05516 [Armadillidium vulgare]|nr:hypothetical protein Avbf_05516 [Armadillidium vulgare]
MSKSGIDKYFKAQILLIIHYTIGIQCVGSLGEKFSIILIIIITIIGGVIRILFSKLIQCNVDYSQQIIKILKLYILYLGFEQGCWNALRNYSH